MDSDDGDQNPKQNGLVESIKKMPRGGEINVPGPGTPQLKLSLGRPLARLFQRDKSRFTVEGGSLRFFQDCI